MVCRCLLLFKLRRFFTFISIFYNGRNERTELNYIDDDIDTGALYIYHFLYRINYHKKAEYADNWYAKYQEACFINVHICNFFLVGYFNNNKNRKRKR